MINFLIYLLLYGTISVAGELLNYKFKIKAEITRTLMHVSSGIVAVTMPFFLNKGQIIVLCIIFFFVFGLSRVFKVFNSLHGIERKSLGALVFPIAIGIAAYSFLPQNQDYYILSMLMLAISDPLANFVGGKLKRSKIIFGKTLPGSIAFFLSAFLFALYFLPLGWSFAVALVATATEMFSPFGLDNITIIISMVFLLNLI